MTGVIPSLMVMVMLTLAVATDQQVTAPGHFLVIGHRGDSFTRPEESSSSYQSAGSVGADFLECDLCSTADGHLVLVHDCELSGVSDIESGPLASRLQYNAYWNRTGYFTEQLTLAELRSVRLQQRLAARPQGFNGLDPLLTLEEFLRLAGAVGQTRGRPVGVYIETKHPQHFRGLGLPLEEKLVSALDGYYGGAARASCSGSTAEASFQQFTAGSAAVRCLVLLQSFEPSSLQRLQTLAPEYPRVLLLDTPESIVPDDQLLLPAEQQRTYGWYLSPEGIATTRSFANALGPFYGSLSGEVVARAHTNHLLVHPYTLRPEANFLPAGMTFSAALASWLEMGVDGVFTDSPGLVAAAISTHPPTPSSSLPSGSSFDTMLMLLANLLVVGLILLIILYIVHLLKNAAAHNYAVIAPQQTPREELDP